MTNELNQNLREVIQEIEKEYESIKGKTPWENIDNLARQVSDNLYLDNFHFVLEIIQNAVDSVSNRVRISFRLFQDEGQAILIVANDGKPFSEQDIRRLCGNTKQRKGLQKIGYKGIGFKSVIKISNNPQIYSPYCQFEFKKDSDSTHAWLYVPHWIPNEMIPDFVKEKPTWVHFRLPFHESLIEKGVEQVSLQLDDLPPELLLFLDTLEQLHVTNEYSQKSIQLHKTQLNEYGLVAIEKITQQNHPTELGRWLITSYQPQNPPLEALRNFKEERGFDKQTQISDEEISKTEIKLAFQVDTSGYFKEAEGFLYAFFPTKAESGWRFATQADFLTLAHREQLQPKSAWNSWLISNLSEALITCIETLKQNSTGIMVLYESFPLEHEGENEEFKKVAKEVVIKLRQLPIVLTNTGNYICPIQAVWLDDTLRKYNLLDDTDISQLYPDKLAFVSFSIQGHKRTKTFLTSYEGLRVIKCEHKKLLNALANQTWLENKNNDIEWFTKLFRYLANYLANNVAQSELENLRSLALIPTTKGLLPANSHHLFIRREPTIHLTGAYFVHDELVKDDDVFEFLRDKLGIKEASPEKLIEDVIIPYMVLDEIVLLPEYARFVKSYWENREDDQLKSELEKCFKLMAMDNQWHLAKELCLTDARKVSGYLLEGAPESLFVSEPQPFEDEPAPQFYRWVGVHAKPPKNILLTTLKETDWFKDKDTSWFCTLYAYLADEQIKKTDIKELQIIHTYQNNERFNLPLSYNIYFANDDLEMGKFSDIFTEHNIYFVVDEVFTRKSVFFSKTNIKLFLESLDIKLFTREDLADLMFKEFEKYQYEDDRLIEYTLFILETHHRKPLAWWQKFKDVVRIKSTQGTWQSPKNIYLTSQLELLQGLEVDFVDSAYRKQDSHLIKLLEINLFDENRLAQSIVDKFRHGNETGQDDNLLDYIHFVFENFRPNETTPVLQQFKAVVKLQDLDGNWHKPQSLHLETEHEDLVHELNLPVQFVNQQFFQNIHQIDKWLNWLGVKKLDFTEIAQVIIKQFEIAYEKKEPTDILLKGALFIFKEFDPDKNEEMAKQFKEKVKLVGLKNDRGQWDTAFEDLYLNLPREFLEIIKEMRVSKPRFVSPFYGINQHANWLDYLGVQRLNPTKILDLIINEFQHSNISQDYTDDLISLTRYVLYNQHILVGRPQEIFLAQVRIKDSSEKWRKPNELFLPLEEPDFEDIISDLPEIHFVHSEYSEPKISLDLLGIPKLNSAKIIEKISLVFETPNVLKDRLWRLTEFAITQNPKNLEILKSTILIKTTDGTWQKPQSVYLTKLYNPYDFEKLLADFKGIYFVSPDYLALSTHQDEIINFLKKMDIQTTLVITENQTTLLEKIICTPEPDAQKNQRLEVLMQILADGWLDYFAKGVVPPRISALLKNNPILPTTKGLKKNSEIPIYRNNAPYISDLVGKDVAYIIKSIKLRLSKDDRQKYHVIFCDFMQIIWTPDKIETSDVLRYLGHLSLANKNDSETKKHSVEIYKFLANKSIKLPKDKPLIFCPTETCIWWKPTQVFWSHRYEKWFGSLRAYVENYYNNFLHSSTFQNLGVNINEPTSEQWVDFLIDAGQLQQINEDLKKAIWQAYLNLEEYLQQNQNPEDKWWSDFVNSDPLLLTEKSGFKRSSEIYIDDYPFFYDVFKDKLPFLQWGNSEKIATLISYFKKFRLISKSVTSEIEPGNEVLDNRHIQEFYDIINKNNIFICSILTGKIDKHKQNEEFNKRLNMVRGSNFEIKLVKKLALHLLIKDNPDVTFDDEEIVAYWEDDILYLDSSRKMAKLFKEGVSAIFKEFGENLTMFFGELWACENYKEKYYFLTRTLNIRLQSETELPGKESLSTEDEGEEHPNSPQYDLDESDQNDSETNDDSTSEPLSSPHQPEMKSPGSQPTHNTQKGNTSQSTKKDSPSTSRPINTSPGGITPTKNSTPSSTHHTAFPTRSSVQSETPHTRLPTQPTTPRPPREVTVITTLDEIDKPIVKDFIKEAKEVREHRLNQKRKGHTPTDEMPDEITDDEPSYEDKQIIGRNGEFHAINYLIDIIFLPKYANSKVVETEYGYVIKSNGNTVVQIRWPNKIKSNSKEPYDIEVIERGIHSYYEVKATQSETKTWFDISRNEWEKAKEEKDNFYIVHVRNALDTQAIIRVIPNPCKQWEDGYLKAYVVRVSW